MRSRSSSRTPAPRSRSSKALAGRRRPGRLRPRPGTTPRVAPAGKANPVPAGLAGRGLNCSALPPSALHDFPHPSTHPDLLESLHDPVPPARRIVQGFGVPRPPRPGVWRVSAPGAAPAAPAIRPAVPGQAVPEPTAPVQAVPALTVRVSAPVPAPGGCQAPDGHRSRVCPPSAPPRRTPARSLSSIHTSIRLCRVSKPVRDLDAPRRVHGLFLH